MTGINVGARSARVAHRLRLGLLALTIAGCRADTATSVRFSGEESLAKGGGGSGSGTAPTVTSTNPTFAYQDTTIDVNVFGTGFTTGARATWRTGLDSTSVLVKSTKVVSSTQIVARIIVPAGAPVSKYDVEVTLSNGKKGVGAEMFDVLLGDPAASFWFPTNDGSLGLLSDGLYLNGTSSVYANGVCGVTAKIFATTAASNSGDATLQTDNPRNADRKCAAYPRKVTVVYGPGDQASSTVFINVRELASTSYQIPIGTTVRRGLHVNEARCGGLVYQGQLGDGTSTGGADSVNVTRVSSSSWLVESRPYPDNEAYCKATGVKYNIAVRFTVVSSQALP